MRVKKEYLYVIKKGELFVNCFPSVYVLGQWSPSFLTPGTSFVEDNFSLNQRWRVGGEGDFRMIQAHYIHCAFYFYYDYISFISDHQALDPEVGDP